MVDDGVQLRRRAIMFAKTIVTLAAILTIGSATLRRHGRSGEL
jgi:hypothetical protein